MIIVVIPLRLESSRIPRKILADVAGASLCERTVGRTLNAFEGMNDVEVVAAVDSPEAKKNLQKSFPKLKIYLTDPELPSGTDRVFAAVGMWLDANPGKRGTVQGILNVQGDMPYVGQEGLRQIAAYFAEKSKSSQDQKYLLTLAQEWPENQGYADLGAVKVLSDRAGKALYFSRFPIPYSRIPHQDQKAFLGELHIGVYGFTLESLSLFCSHAATDLERAESLEQLRALWLGMPIYVLKTEAEAGASFRGVDTPEDLEWARTFAQKEKV